VTTLKRYPLATAGAVFGAVLLIWLEKR